MTQDEMIEGIKEWQSQYENEIPNPSQLIPTNDYIRYRIDGLFKDLHKRERRLLLKMIAIECKINTLHRGMAAQTIYTAIMLIALGLLASLS